MAGMYGLGGSHNRFIINSSASEDNFIDYSALSSGLTPPGASGHATGCSSCEPRLAAPQCRNTALAHTHAAPASLSHVSNLGQVHQTNVIIGRPASRHLDRAA
jgi:hypothetical protein